MQEDIHESVCVCLYTYLSVYMCSVISLHMDAYWIILILILISNVPICKFKYESMFDHYANHHLYNQLCRLPSA